MNRVLPFSLLVLIAGTPVLGATAPRVPIVDGCTDRHGEAVESAENLKIPFVARAAVVTDEAIIWINPEFREKIFLGPESLSWLYYRECAHIFRGHPLKRRQKLAEEFNRLQEEAADCQAITWLVEKHGYGDREIKIILREMDGLESWEWEGLRVGPRRRSNLYECRER